MATLTIVKFLFQMVLVCIGAYALIREKELARLERKAARYVKAFFKALYLSAKEKKGTGARVTPLYAKGNEEYAEILDELNYDRAAQAEDVLVA